MIVTLKLRRGTAAEWFNKNPVLKQGEPGWEIDTNKTKVGDGSTAWNDLEYQSAPGPQGPQGERGIQGPQGDVGPTGNQGPPGTTTVDGLTDATSTGKSIAKANDAASVRTIVSAVKRDELVFNVKDYGAKGDGSDDIVAITSAVAAAKIAGVLGRGATVFFPPGYYLISSPIILPRTGSTPTNVVTLKGASVRSTTIVANSSFPSSRAMVEWETSISRTWHQEISDLTFALPNVTGTRAIHYKKTAAGTSLTDFNNERMQIALKNLLIEGNNGYHTSLVKLEGQVFYSIFDQVRGDNARSSLLGATVYSPVTDYDTATFEFDSNLYGQPLSSDVLGFSYGSINNCSGGSLRRGGSGVLVRGKMKNSTIQDGWCDGGRYDPGVELINAFNVMIVNTGNEGKTATQFRFKDSQNINLSQFAPSSQDPEFPDWSASTSYTTAWGVIVPGWRTANTGAAPTNNNWYKCIVAGISGSSQPSWPTSIGSTVVDGGVTWECMGSAVKDAIVIDGGRSITLDRVATGPSLPNYSARGCKMLSMLNSPTDVVAQQCVAPDNPIGEISWTATSGFGEFLGARNGERVIFGTPLFVAKNELVVNLFDYNVKPSNTASQNASGFAAAAASGATNFYLPSGTYQVQLTEGQNLMSFVGKNHLTIRGDNALLVDTTSYTFQSTFTTMFLLDGCSDVSISGIRYQGPTLDTPNTQMGYQGGLFVRAINGTSGVRVDAELTNLRYGVQTGDYSIPSKGGCKNFDLNLRCSMVGYPVAAYRADGLRLNIDADSVHRAAYIAGCDDVRGVVKFKDQYIADKAFLITDALVSGDDVSAQANPSGAATTSRGSTNIDVSVIDKGSTIMPTSASLCGIILSRVDPVTFANIRVRVHTKSTDTISRYYAGFHIASDAKTVWSRYPFNWESTIVLENVSVSGVIDHSAQTLSGNTQGDIYIVTYESSHSATVRNINLNELTILKGSASPQQCRFEAPGLIDIARLDVNSPGQNWLINTNGTSIVRLQNSVIGTLTSGTSKVSPLDSVAYGVGSPEGVVVASIGTIYVDTAVTLGVSVWRKNTGTGSTGWKVLSGDTGWRTVTSTSAQVSGTFAIRRKDDLVELYALTLASLTSPTSPETIYALPTGYRPFATNRFLFSQAGGIQNKLGIVSGGGSLQIFGVSASVTVQFNAVYTTSDAWPTSLPGV